MLNEAACVIFDALSTDEKALISRMQHRDNSLPSRLSPSQVTIRRPSVIIALLRFVEFEQRSLETSKVNHERSAITQTS